MWGICHKDLQVTSCEPAADNYEKTPRIVMSKSESEQVHNALSSRYKLISASGAGYKILVTVKGLANAYVLSHQSIYRWDCCALHAILLALGGGIVSYKHAIETALNTEGQVSVTVVENLQLNYVKAAGAIASRSCSLPGSTDSLPGIIAYRSVEDLLDILELLKVSHSQ